MPSGLITNFIIMAVVFIVALLSYANNTIVFLYLLVLFPIIVYFVNHIDKWMVLTLALYSSNVGLPFLPSSVNIYHVMCLGLAGMLVAHKIVKKESIPISPLSRKLLIVFLLLTLFTALYRGMGLRFLGSNLWGGGRYLGIWMPAALYLMTRNYSFPARTWLGALIGVVILSFIPAVAELIYLISKGKIYQQYYFLQLGGGMGAYSNLAALETGQGVARFHTMIASSFITIFPMVLFPNPFRGKHCILTAAIWVTALILIFLSGFRSALLGFIGVILLWMLLRKQKVQWRQALGTFVVFFFMISVLALLGRHLPLSFQRALSFLPYADVSYEAKWDAVGTTIWRVEMWKNAINLIPQYFWIGEGFAYRGEESISIMRYSLSSTVAESALFDKSYHNGPLSLILTLGIFGLLVGSAFLIVQSIQHYRLLRADWPDDLLRRIHLSVVCLFFIQVIMFFSIYGDAFVSFPVFIFYSILLDGIEMSRLHLLRPKVADAIPYGLKTMLPA